MSIHHFGIGISTHFFLRSLFPVTSSMIVCPGFRRGDGLSTMAGADLVLFGFWNQLLSSNTYAHAPKSNRCDIASGGGALVSIESRLNVSNIPFLAGKVFKFPVTTSTSYLTMNLGVLLNRKPCAIPLIPSFDSLLVILTSSRNTDPTTASANFPKRRRVAVTIVGLWFLDTALWLGNEEMEPMRRTKTKKEEERI